MGIHLHLIFILLAVWNELVYTQIAGIATTDTPSSVMSSGHTPSSSAVSVSTIESSAEPSSSRASSTRAESSTNSAVTATSSLILSTPLTIAPVQPEAESSSESYISSQPSFSPTPLSTKASTITQSSYISSRNSEESTSSRTDQEETTSTANQDVETTTLSESTEENNVSTVTVETTSDVASSSIATEFSTYTIVDSTPVESTMEPESTTYQTTIMSTIIDVVSPGKSSMTTEKPSNSTESSSDEYTTTESRTYLPTPESNRESCFGQAEVNTAMIVAIVVSVNIITIAVTAFCVHRLVSRRLSWDPPPMNIMKQRAAVGVPRPAPRTGIHLATDNECRAGESPATQIPIVITNEDGWCVPYSEQDQKKKTSSTNGTEDTGV
ncbi:hypothetical protein SK128_028090 [Halocaridina rubra]|uniref:Uncharacterized protein n=1 Tax=Halocaridina rubra TaxID=373956 RepID=A0AAN8X3V9_HALRR